MEGTKHEDLSAEERQLLVQRYIQLREQNKKTHLCAYYFRQRCLKSAENCTYAHGLEELVRMPSAQLLETRQEIYNIKQRLKSNHFVVLFNLKSRRYEVYKTRDIQRLRGEKLKEWKEGADVEAEDEDDEDDHEDKNFNRKGVSKLDLYQYNELKEVKEKEQLYEIYEFNKVIDSEDEVNMVKRVPRTKEEREQIVKPFQNKLMADFLRLLWYEAGDELLDRDTVINKYNEAGVPLTWSRLNLSKIHFEKKLNPEMFPNSTIENNHNVESKQSEPAKQEQSSSAQIEEEKISKPKAVSKATPEEEKSSLFETGDLNKDNNNQDEEEEEESKEEGKVSKQKQKKKDKRKQMVAILPLKPPEANLETMENLIIGIISSQIGKDMEKTKFPFRITDIQKQYQIRMQPRDPPMHVLMKQLEVDMDQLFYQVLESRGNIRQWVIQYLQTTFPSQDWATTLAQGLQSNKLHLFMPFSHECLKAKEVMEAKLQAGVTICSIVEQGVFNDYVAKNFSQLVKNVDEFDRVSWEVLHKYGYRKIKTGTGVYLTNPYAFEPGEGATFRYEATPCQLCLEKIPDLEVLEQMVMAGKECFGQLDFVQYYGEGDSILIVNNFSSLQIALAALKSCSAVGIDLEGRLKKGGAIDLIQVACESQIFIFDVFEATVLSQNFDLMEQVNGVLKWLFLNEAIRKVFFDCKKDMEAMHFVFSVGVRNVFDIQPVHMALTQFAMQNSKKHHEQKLVATPGLNDVLGSHEVSHGVNTLKKKFKKIFSDHKLNKEMFGKRPLHPDFVSYAAQDVEDLVELSYLLEAKIETVFQAEDLHHLQDKIHGEYRYKLCQDLSQAYADISCQKMRKDMGEKKVK